MRAEWFQSKRGATDGEQGTKNHVACAVPRAISAQVATHQETRRSEFRNFLACGCLDVITWE